MWIPFGRPGAVARVVGGNTAPCLYGTVKLYQMGRTVLVVADICGLPVSETGIFGLHIHEGCACAGDGFVATGGHFNPGGQPHPKHAGDLPPLFSCGGKAFLAALTDRFSICDVIGRAVVIHSQPDDFSTQPAGNAGDKIACGIIAVA